MPVSSEFRARLNGVLGQPQLQGVAPTSNSAAPAKADAPVAKEEDGRIQHLAKPKMAGKRHTPNPRKMQFVGIQEPQADPAKQPATGTKQDLMQENTLEKELSPQPHAVKSAPAETEHSVPVKDEAPRVVQVTHQKQSCFSRFFAAFFNAIGMAIGVAARLLGAR